MTSDVFGISEVVMVNNPDAVVVVTPPSLQGPPGVQGPPGQGLPGTPGQPGAIGLSAYEVWLAAGHVGSVADFFTSLGQVVNFTATAPLYISNNNISLDQTQLVNDAGNF